MSTPIKVAALIAVFGLHPTAQGASSDRYILEPANKLRQFDTFDSIAEQRGDLVVFDASGRWWARYIAFAVAQSYDEREALIELIRQKIPVGEVKEGMSTSRPDAIRDWPSSDTRGTDDGLRTEDTLRVEKGLRSKGVALNDYRQTEIVSAPFNGTANSGVYSTLVFTLVDARPIFARDCVVLVVTRFDRSREWSRLAHTPIVFPFRTTATTKLVSNAELEIIKSLLQTNARSFSGPIINGPLEEPLKSPASLVLIKGTLSEVCSK